jgi:dipeptidyl aminopeptidase/acylaminoacyl peptidase
MRASIVLGLSLVLPSTAWPASFTAAEMMKLKRLADPALSPDGKWVAYQQTDVALPSGTRNTDIWVVPVTGGEPRRLTSHPKSDSRPRWSPDGKQLAFLSNRDGSSQVYVLDLAGGEPRKLSALANDVDAFAWIDGRTVLAKSEVFPDRREESAKPASSARVYDHLLYRHWDTWEDGRASHLLVVPLDGGVPRDLTPGERDVPPFSLGGPDDFGVSPDGREVCFSRNDDKVQALSTNADLFVVAVAGGEPKKIAGNPGYDGACRYSPDGTMIAFRAQMRAGYESDRWRLLVYDRASGATRNLTEGFDRHAGEPVWSPDSKTLYFAAEDQARSPIYAVAALGGPVRPVVTGGSFGDVQVAAGGRTLVFSKVALQHPAEIYRAGVDGTGLAPVTRINDALLAGFGLRPGESITYPGAAGKSIQAWIVKPADFDPTSRYPLLVLIHGGPQGAWEDGWSFRWNAQVFANAGYVVFMPNPRGSTGFGQEHVDDINGDWGGKCFEDIMKGTDFAETLPYVAKGRTVAAGASFGGYMINWIAGHTDRYRALVSHDGLFDVAAAYGATEELWFNEWEFKGTPWDNPELYARLSPSSYVKSFKTPTLVVHGELDFRVPLEQGLAMFTALQRRGVPSKLMVFPEENHWVLKPLDSLKWYEEVLGWLGQWSKSTP